MFPNPIRNNDSAVKNIGELLSYSDEQFVHKAFLALLGREPDREGMRYYLDRLKKGYSKEIIIVQLSASDEAREHNCQITGLEELLVKENRASHRCGGAYPVGVVRFGNSFGLDLERATSS
jgi:hypothetical protein